MFGVEDDLHGRVVDEEEVDFHVGIAAGDVLHDLSPEAGGFEYVGLVDEGQFLAALLGLVESKVGDTLDLFAGIDAFVGSLGAFGVELFFAKVDAAGQFAEDDEIDVLEDLAFSGERCCRAG